jgi:hypothetical protein
MTTVRIQCEPATKSVPKECEMGWAEIIGVMHDLDPRVGPERQ